MRKIFPIFSYIFHPVLMPLWSTGCYFFIMIHFYSPKEIGYTLFQVAVMTFLLPIAIFIFLKSLGMLQSSIMVHNLRERFAPIFLNIVLIGILVFQIFENNNNIALKKFFIAYSTSYIIMFFFVWMRKKFSIHMMSFCAMIPFLAISCLQIQQSPIYVLAILVLLAGCLATSRLSLYAHSNQELICGSIIGIVPQIVIFYVPVTSVISYSIHLIP